MGSLRHRPGRHDPGDRHRAGDGDRSRRLVNPDHRLHHPYGLAAVPVPGRAGRDDAGTHRRIAVLRLSRLQGSLAKVRKAHQRLHRLGLLAGVVPGGAAQHDPGLVLPSRSLRHKHHRRIHADPHIHRLVDAGHFDRRASSWSSSRPIAAFASEPRLRPSWRCCR